MDSLHGYVEVVGPLVMGGIQVGLFVWERIEFYVEKGGEGHPHAVSVEASSAFLIRLREGSEGSGHGISRRSSWECPEVLQLQGEPRRNNIWNLPREMVGGMIPLLLEVTEEVVPCC